jgi:PAS domain S-box-containing protein
MDVLEALLQASPLGIIAIDSRRLVRFRELLEAAPDAIIEVDREGRIVLLNLVTEKLFGYSREELLGQPVELLVPDAFAPVTRSIAKGLLGSSGDPPDGQRPGAAGPRKDGSRFPVEISLSPVKSEDGFRVTAVIRDISERKRPKDRIAKCSRPTRASWSSRNREVERANQLKSEFLASMSHELRTPLHTIIGFAELLGEELEGPLNEKQKRFMNHIHTDSMHLLELINDILDLSKIESGRLELRREALILPRRRGGAFLRPAAGGRPSRSRSRPAVAIPAILRGPAPRQADSAQPAEQRGEIHAEGRKIRSRRGWNGEFLEISVTDTGIGIPRSSTRRFSTSSIRSARHHQRRARRHRAGPGDHQGAGGGTRRTIRSKASPARAAVSRSPSRMGPSGMKKVLVADDKATSRELVRTVLENSGYSRGFEAATAPRSAASARESKPDLIILDLHMPGWTASA